MRMGNIVPLNGLRMAAKDTTLGDFVIPKVRLLSNLGVITEGFVYFVFNRKTICYLLLNLLGDLCFKNKQRAKLPEYINYISYMYCSPST